MNAVEHIVECYFRYCKSCFTMADVKIQSGINRQADLLAYNAVTKEQFHVESSVTHCKNWAPSAEDLRGFFDNKFLGLPKERQGKETDYAKGKNYFDNIRKTYLGVGFTPSRVKRVFVVWKVKDGVNVDEFSDAYYKERRIRVKIWSFCNQILPELQRKIGTSNYEDEILRTLSLLRQHDLQARMPEPNPRV